MIWNLMRCNNNYVFKTKYENFLWNWWNSRKLNTLFIHHEYIVIITLHSLSVFMGEFSVMTSNTIPVFLSLCFGVIIILTTVAIGSSTDNAKNNPTSMLMKVAANVSAVCHNSIKLKHSTFIKCNLQILQDPYKQVDKCPWLNTEL